VSQAHVPVEVNRGGRDLGSTACEGRIRGHAQHTTDLTPP
jgi:hypothetical protein